jgi:hypothetical protein
MLAFSRKKVAMNTKNMSDCPHVPHRVTVMGNALRLTLERLERGMRRPVASHRAVDNMLDLVQHHLRAIGEHVDRLSQGVDGLMTEVVSFESASDAVVYRAVGRFEAHLDAMLAGLQSVRSLHNAFGADIRARDLLGAAYDHLLAEVRDWLMSLVVTIADPFAALQRRGLSTTGPIELSVTMKLTPPPEFAALLQWGREQYSVLPGTERRKQVFWKATREISLGVVLGTLLFG